MAITFLTPAVSGSHVNEEQCYAIHGPWLQILIPDQNIDEMLNDMQDILELTIVSAIFFKFKI